MQTIRWREIEKVFETEEETEFNRKTTYREKDTEEKTAKETGRQSEK